MREIVIVILISICILFIFRGGNNIPIVTTVTLIDTVYSKDTIVTYKKGDKIPFRIIDTFLSVKTDTIKIINDYLTVKAYSDTIRQDSNVFYILDTITENKIKGRSFKAELSQKTIYSTTTITTAPKNELYMGFLGDLRRFDNKVGIGVGLIYKAQNKAYSVSFTTNEISAGYFIKIR